MKYKVDGEIQLLIGKDVVINAKIISLLAMIERTGSLNTAVKEMGISYSHAWNTINKINCQLEKPILITQRGGKGGGIATITSEGKELMRIFFSVSSDFRNFLRSAGNEK